MARGGPRTPSHPAPTSGPGALSRRTDGGPAQKLREITGLPYGQNQALNAEQAAAPLAQTPAPSAAPAPTRQVGPGGAGVAPPPSFDSPTERPGEPVTAGASMGPGPGPDALGIPSSSAQSYSSALGALQGIAGSGGSAEVAALLNQMQERS